MCVYTCIYVWLHIHRQYDSKYLQCVDSIHVCVCVANVSAESNNAHTKIQPCKYIHTYIYTCNHIQVAEEEKSLLRKQFAEFSDTTALMDNTKELEGLIATLRFQLEQSKMMFFCVFPFVLLVSKACVMCLVFVS
jgi:hypothetical protein